MKRAITIFTFFIALFGAAPAFAQSYDVYDAYAGSRVYGGPISGVSNGRSYHSFAGRNHANYSTVDSSVASDGQTQYVNFFSGNEDHRQAGMYAYGSTDHFVRNSQPRVSPRLVEYYARLTHLNRNNRAQAKTYFDNNVLAGLNRSMPTFLTVTGTDERNRDHRVIHRPTKRSRHRDPDSSNNDEVRNSTKRTGDHGSHPNKASY